MGVTGFDIGMDHLTGKACGARVLAAPPGLLGFIPPVNPWLTPWARVLAPLRGLVCGPSRGADGSGGGMEDSLSP
jgi:hypothetical protein